MSEPKAPFPGAGMSDSKARQCALNVAQQLPVHLPDAMRVLAYAADLARFKSGQTDTIRETETDDPFRVTLKPVA